MSDVVVLCYHAVSDRWPAPLSVSSAQLEEQLGALLRRGYRGATFRDAVTAPPAEKTVAVTFDDAFASVYERAAPILERLGIPGTVFVPTEHVANGPMLWPGIDHWLGTEYEGELAGMSWQQIGELAAAGWEIGSHTRSHPHLTRLGDDSLAHELGASRARLEDILGQPCVALAYPYGDTDERVESAAADAGYTVAATLPHRFSAAPRLLAWPRVGVYRADGRLAYSLKVSRHARRVRVSPAWGAVAAATRAVRRLLRPASAPTE